MRKDKKSFGMQIVRERLELWAKEKLGKSYLELIPQPNGMKVMLGIPV